MSYYFQSRFGILVLMCCSGQALAANYTITDLGTLGGPYSRATAINASGQVVGIAALSVDTEAHAFFYDGSIHDLGTFGGRYSEASGINASGQIVGDSHLTGDTAAHAFLYDHTMQDLGTLGGTESYSTGINASGQIVGYSLITSDSAGHAFQYDGTMHDLGTLGGTNSFATGINTSGQIAGYSDNEHDAAAHAFIYDGTMHDLGTLGGTNSYSASINDNGWVAGGSDISGDTAQHAFLYNGTLHDLGTLGGSISYAFGINSSGLVVGDSRLAGNKVSHAFLFDSTLHDINDLVVSGSVWEITSAAAINDIGEIVGTGKFHGKEHAVLLTPVPTYTNNGYRSPSANHSNGGGDGNGYEFYPTNAYVADGVSAEDIDSGSDLGTSCASACKDKHRFYNFGFNIPAASTITGLEVRLKANADSANGSPRIYAQVSWDGGKSWTARKRTKVLGTVLTNYRLGNSTDTWGRAWNASDFTDANFRVRLIDISSDITSDFSLDSVDVRVSHN